jgi:hypothetical protein
LRSEFPDFFTIPLPGECPTPYFPMVMIMDNGNMNPLGRLEYGAMMRHRNPLLCTMTHTAFYLLYRWNMIINEIRRWQAEGMNTGATAEEAELIRIVRSTVAASAIPTIKAAEESAQW